MAVVTLSGTPDQPSLLGNRFLTLATVVRVRQIEMTRDDAEGPDESSVHTPVEARLFRETIARAWPDARITWAFSWRALNDQRRDYRELRQLVVTYHQRYGDEITFIPGGFFANMYNTREQVNRDLHDGLRLASKMVGGGYRPRAVIAGFLAADNLRYLAEQENIHVCQGNIWSQHAIDNGDGDGSISYPYYPSRQHFLKPARGRDDLIDIVNLMAGRATSSPRGAQAKRTASGAARASGPLRRCSRMGRNGASRRCLRRRRHISMRGSG